MTNDLQKDAKRLRQELAYIIKLAAEIQLKDFTRLKNNEIPIEAKNKLYQVKVLLNDIDFLTTEELPF